MEGSQNFCAAPNQGQIPGAQSVQVCTFDLDGSWYGFDISCVQEVNRAQDIYPIPHSPDHVRGFMNIRGQIHLIVDLRALMGRNASELKPDNRVIVFKREVQSDFGVLVDRMRDIIDMDEGRVQPREGHADSATRQSAPHTAMIKADCMLDSRLVMLLDPRKVVERT